MTHARQHAFPAAPTSSPPTQSKAPPSRSFGLRRSGNTADRPEGRAPEHASSKAVTSAQVPALQTWLAGRPFGVLPACRSFGLRRSGNEADRPEGRAPEHASSKAITSAQVPALQNLGGGEAVIWSASGLPELWIAPEREHGGSARRACSRACVIQSCHKCTSASTPNLGGGAAVIWSASGLPELWIAPEREHFGSGRRACSRACVIQSGHKCQHSETWVAGGDLELPACRWRVR